MRRRLPVGACAISGGPYPPHPYTILEGLLTLVGRLERKAAAGGKTAAG
ncbi:MAG: hypothetical protein QM765_32575 [Myxococcales bacterium]